MKQWHVVSTKRSSEVQASVNISALGYETLCPMLQQRRMNHGKREVINAPMFPSYIFSRFDTGPQGDYWPPIAYTRGVVRIMCDLQAKPVPIRDNIVDMLRSRSGEMEIQMREIYDLEPGDRVLIDEGPFAGLEGLFAKRAQDRVWVLLDLLGKRHELIFSDSAISVAEPSDRHSGRIAKTA